MELVLSWKLHLHWLAVLLEDAKPTAMGRKQTSVSPSCEPARKIVYQCYGSNQPRLKFNLRPLHEVELIPDIVNEPGTRQVMELKNLLLLC